MMQDISNGHRASTVPWGHALAGPFRGHVADGSRPAPGRRLRGVSSYRVFMTIVFVFVVALDEWLDHGLSTIVSADLVGESSVILWALTVIGSFGVGPVAAVWNAIRRR